MPLTGDPSPCTILYQVTDLGNGSLRLRRRASSGTQFHISDFTVPAAEKECANFIATTMAATEGGTAQVLP
ncbi:MAG: hypothetical protein V4527_18135 [Pseudomonadota bacterium]